MKVTVPILVQDVEATAAEGIRATDDDTIEDAFVLDGPAAREIWGES